MILIYNSNVQPHQDKYIKFHSVSLKSDKKKERNMYLHAMFPNLLIFNVIGFKHVFY